MSIFHNAKPNTKLGIHSPFLYSPHIFLAAVLAMVFAIVLLLGGANTAFAKNTTAAEKAPQQSSTEDTAETAKVAPLPDFKNAAYILMDYGTGQILAEKNADMALPPASLTKMMTSYILEQRLTAGSIKENDAMQVSKYAACNLRKGESCMFLKAGKSAKVIDVLRGIVIQSGNDASRAAAEHISETEEKFATLMNQEAAKLGLKNTHFKNSTGMPAEGHESTAKDLAILAKAIIQKNSRYYPIYAEKTFTYNKIKQYNRNRLLFTGKSVDGLKTGHTEEAGFCLVASAKRKDMRLISVVLGTDSKAARTNQTRKLINWGYDNFKTKAIAPKNSFVSKTKVWFGQEKEVNLGLSKDFNVIVPKSVTGNIKTTQNFPDSLKAPLKKGQVVGDVSAHVNGKVIATVPIQVMQDVPEANFFGRLWDHARLFFKKLIGE